METIAPARPATAPQNAPGVVAFDAVQQLKIAPDRRYRVESRSGTLFFRTTGSQFDRDWLVRGARSLIGERAAETLARVPKRQLLLWGIGISAVSALLIAFVVMTVTGSSVTIRSRDFQAFAVLGIAFAAGIVMIVAGLSSDGEGASGQRHDFCLRIPQIRSARLLRTQPEAARRGEPQVARVELEISSGKPIRLSIPTRHDLEALRTVFPRLTA